MRSAPTRTQRRMERKQAILLLVMVLAVAVVSFTLGVMVGRGRSGERAGNASGNGQEKVVTKQPAPSSDASGEKQAAESSAADLTFYETLPKGEKSPLGSGINLPPEQETATAEPQPLPEKPAPEAKQPPAQASSKPAGGGASGAAPSGGGSSEAVQDEGRFILQVASFRDLKGALSLQEKLHRKGYPAEVREVDLGDKGVWIRVVVGPFSSRSKAMSVLERLKNEEGLSPMIRKG